MIELDKENKAYILYRIKGQKIEYFKLDIQPIEFIKGDFDQEYVLCSERDLTGGWTVSQVYNLLQGVKISEEEIFTFNPPYFIKIKADSTIYIVASYANGIQAYYLTGKKVEYSQEDLKRMFQE